MVKETSGLVFIVSFLCIWVLFLTFSGKTIPQPSVPSNISFSAESNVIYFLDRDNAKIYRYNTQGRLTRIYIIEELGKDLKSE